MPPRRAATPSAAGSGDGGGSDGSDDGGSDDGDVEADLDTGDELVFGEVNGDDFGGSAGCSANPTQSLPALLGMLGLSIALIRRRES